MKNLKLAGFEIYLLQESLKHYKSLIGEEKFPKNSIVTKEYVENMIAQLEGKMSDATIQEKARKTYAAS